MSVDGSVVMLTGAAGGLGRAVTRAFVNAGARVAIMDVDTEGLAGLDEAVRAVAGAGNVLALPGDIADPVYVADAVDRTVDRFGRIDVLINSAGLGMGVIRPDHMDNLIGIGEIAADVWRRFIDVNLTGPFLLIKAVAPHMAARGRGRIIAITTSFFTMLRDGFAPYGASKAGLEALLSGLARELAASGITVNIVHPPFTKTDRYPARLKARAEQRGVSLAEAEASFTANFPIGRIVEPDDIAPMVLFLASAQAAAVTGQAIAVDGGATPYVAY